MAVTLLRHSQHLISRTLIRRDVCCGWCTLQVYMHAMQCILLPTLLLLLLCPMIQQQLSRENSWYGWLLSLMDLDGHRDKDGKRIAFYIVRISVECTVPAADHVSPFTANTTANIVRLVRNKQSSPIVLMRRSLSPMSSPSIWHGWMLSSSSSAQV